LVLQNTNINRKNGWSEKLNNITNIIHFIYNCELFLVKMENFYCLIKLVNDYLLLHHYNFDKFISGFQFGECIGIRFIIKNSLNITEFIDVNLWIESDEIVYDICDKSESIFSDHVNSTYMEVDDSPAINQKLQERVKNGDNDTNIKKIFNEIIDDIESYSFGNRINVKSCKNNYLID